MMHEQITSGTRCYAPLKEFAVEWRPGYPPTHVERWLTFETRVELPIQKFWVVWKPAPQDDFERALDHAFALDEALDGAQSQPARADYGEQQRVDRILRPDWRRKVWRWLKRWLRAARLTK